MAEEIKIEHTFDAPVEAVWKAWTEPELIKKWWGPEGFTAPSIKVDFRVGGQYVYTMHGPAGSPWDKDMYSGGVYKEISPMTKIVYTDYLCDEVGNKMKPQDYEMNKDFPSELEVVVHFEEIATKTKLTIAYPKPDSEAAFEAMLKSGMKEGWTSSLVKLEKSLA